LTGLLGPARHAAVIYAQALGNHPRFRSVDCGQQTHEFFATVATGDVTRSQVPIQNVPNHGQHCITRLMSSGIVDMLEVIDGVQR
jgi:hypothetical protein